jgi:hypothetical protein
VCVRSCCFNKQVLDMLDVCHHLHMMLHRAAYCLHASVVKWYDVSRV